MWQWTLENMPQGLQVDGTGRYAVISVSKRGQNVEEQLHGISVFDLTAEGGGLAKYLYTYRTEGQLPTIRLPSARMDGSSPSSKHRLRCPMKQSEAEIGCISFDRSLIPHIILNTVLPAALDFSP